MMEPQFSPRMNAGIALPRFALPLSNSLNFLPQIAERLRITCDRRRLWMFQLRQIRQCFIPGQGIGHSLSSLPLQTEEPLLK